MAARKRPASRGFVNNIILESLISGDKYGYEIIKEVEDKSNGKIILKQPSLYSSLKRFETKGYITSYWGDSDIGGRRHYYTITELGKNYYNKTINKGFDLGDEDDDDEVITEQIKLEPELNTEPEQTPSEPEQKINTDDDSYNIFELLEKAPKQSPATTQNYSKPETSKENSIQVDMFTTSEHNEVNKEESVNLEKLQQIKLNDSPITPSEPEKIKREIPLIKEQSQDFFSWEDLKRKQVLKNQEELTTTEEDPITIKNQVVMDEFGILKVGETSSERNKEQKIFDNVGARIDYKDPVIRQAPKAEKPSAHEELSEQEREIKNKKFNEKLNNIINQKTTTVEQPEPEIDYKNILGDLLAPETTSEIASDVNYEFEEYEETIPSEVIEEAVVQTQNYNIQPKTSTNFEAEGFKFKPYVTEVDEKEKETNFILVNKARMKYGIFMFVLMVLQISTLFIALRSQELLYINDYIYYWIAYGFAVAFLLICLFPYFIAPDKRKSNTFKLSYSLIFGILLFLATCALTYALNTFAGLNNANVTLFSSKLLLPIILSINFILTPLVYKMVLFDKKVY